MYAHQTPNGGNGLHYSPQVARPQPTMYRLKTQLVLLSDTLPNSPRRGPLSLLQAEGDMDGPSDSVTYNASSRRPSPLRGGGMGMGGMPSMILNDDLSSHAGGLTAYKVKRRFLIIERGEATLAQLKTKIARMYHQMYPHDPSVDILRLKDLAFYDLPDIYRVEEVFGDSDTLFAMATVTMPPTHYPNPNEHQQLQIVQSMAEVHIRSSPPNETPIRMLSTTSVDHSALAHSVSTVHAVSQEMVTPTAPEFQNPRKHSLAPQSAAVDDDNSLPAKKPKFPPARSPSPADHTPSRLGGGGGFPASGTDTPTQAMVTPTLAQATSPTTEMIDDGPSVAMISDIGIASPREGSVVVNPLDRSQGNGRTAVAAKTFASPTIVQASPSVPTLSTAQLARSAMHNITLKSPGRVAPPPALSPPEAAPAPAPVAPLPQPTQSTGSNTVAEREAIKKNDEHTQPPKQSSDSDWGQLPESDSDLDSGSSSEADSESEPEPKATPATTPVSRPAAPKAVPNAKPVPSPRTSAWTQLRPAVKTIGGHSCSDSDSDSDADVLIIPTSRKSGPATRSSTGLRSAAPSTTSVTTRTSTKTSTSIPAAKVTQQRAVASKTPSKPLASPKSGTGSQMDIDSDLGPKTQVTQAKTPSNSNPPAPPVRTSTSNAKLTYSSDSDSESDSSATSDSESDSDIVDPSSQNAQRPTVPKTEAQPLKPVSPIVVVSAPMDVDSESESNSDADTASDTDTDSDTDIIISKVNPTVPTPTIPQANTDVRVAVDSGSSSESEESELDLESDSEDNPKVNNQGDQKQPGVQIPVIPQSNLAVEQPTPAKLDSESDSGSGSDSNSDTDTDSGSDGDSEESNSETAASSTSMDSSNKTTTQASAKATLALNGRRTSGPPGGAISMDLAPGKLLQKSSFRSLSQIAASRQFDQLRTSAQLVTGAAKIFNSPAHSLLHSPDVLSDESNEDDDDDDSDSDSASSASLSSSSDDDSESESKSKAISNSTKTTRFNSSMAKPRGAAGSSRTSSAGSSPPKIRVAGAQRKTRKSGLFAMAM
ncbi:hypothetical protein H4R33_003644 [Dimargaris cristalligena]|nr:hypothetical protein H4R33_003644 [Dimargaris cristalligena]